MVKLCCAIVGEKGIVVVDIDDQQLVGDLMERIKRREGYDFPSSRLTLYLAKENGNVNGEWMKDDDGDLVQLQQAMVPRDIKLMHLKDELLLKPTWSIGDKFTEAPKKNAIHVFVKLPHDESTTINVPDEGTPLVGNVVTQAAQRYEQAIISSFGWMFSSLRWPSDYLSQQSSKTLSKKNL